MQELVAEGDALGLKMDTLTQLGMRLAAAHAWAEDAHTALATARDLADDHRPSIEQALARQKRNVRKVY